jgi:hypothetical protein
MHTSLSLDWCSMSRRVLGITCPPSGGTTRTQNWWLLCAVVDVGWSQDIYTMMHGQQNIKFTHLSYCDKLFAMSFPIKNATTLNEKSIPLVGGQFHWRFPTKVQTKCLMHWSHRLQFKIHWHILSLQYFRHYLPQLMCHCHQQQGSQS